MASTDDTAAARPAASATSRTETAHGPFYPWERYPRVTMSLTQQIKEFIGGDDSGVEVHEYHCNDCGNDFESAKQPERTQCPECISNDVEQV